MIFKKLPLDVQVTLCGYESTWEYYDYYEECPLNEVLIILKARQETTNDVLGIYEIRLGDHLGERLTQISKNSITLDTNKYRFVNNKKLKEVLEDNIREFNLGYVIEDEIWGMNAYFKEIGLSFKDRIKFKKAAKKNAKKKDD